MDLKSITISKCDLKDLTEFDSPMLADLLYLNLSENNICDLEPLMKLTGLQHLDLSNNRIADCNQLIFLIGMKQLLKKWKGALFHVFFDQIQDSAEEFSLVLNEDTGELEQSDFQFEPSLRNRIERKLAQEILIVEEANRILEGKLDYEKIGMENFESMVADLKKNHECEFGTDVK